MEQFIRDSHLSKQKLEEMQSNLQEKNLELAEMNNDLLKQMESHNKSNKNLNGFNFFKSKSPHANHHHTDSGYSHSKSSGHNKSPSLYNFETETEGAPTDTLHNAHR